LHDLKGEQKCFFDKEKSVKNLIQKLFFIFSAYHLMIFDLF